ncbi:MAG: hypothetical protein AAFP17_17905 [Pseudomonadota bacterium]
MFLHSRLAGDPGKASPEEVDFAGARAIFTQEPEATDQFSGKRIKAFVGGQDRRPVRGLQQSQSYYRPRAVPVIAFNRTPRVVGEDEGIRRRLVIFPFVVNLRELPPEKRMTQAEAERRILAELPGILNWMLDGFAEFWRRAEAGIGAPPGIDPPEEMRELKAELLASSDPVGEFLADCCEVVEGIAEVRVLEAYAVYEEWARRTGGALYRPRTFADLLVEKGYPKKKTMGRIHFEGLRWRAEGDVVDILENSQVRARIDGAPGAGGVASAEKPEAEKNDF